MLFTLERDDQNVRQWTSSIPEQANSVEEISRVAESGRRGQGSELFIRPLSAKDVAVNCERKPSAAKSFDKQSTNKDHKKVFLQITVANWYKWHK